MIKFNTFQYAKNTNTITGILSVPVREETSKADLLKRNLLVGRGAGTRLRQCVRRHDISGTSKQAYRKSGGAASAIACIQAAAGAQGKLARPGLCGEERGLARLPPAGGPMAHVQSNA